MLMQGTYIVGIGAVSQRDVLLPFYFGLWKSCFWYEVLVPYHQIEAQYWYL